MRRSDDYRYTSSGQAIPGEASVNPVSIIPSSSLVDSARWRFDWKERRRVLAGMDSSVIKPRGEAGVGLTRARMIRV